MSKKTPQSHKAIKSCLKSRGEKLSTEPCNVVKNFKTGLLHVWACGGMCGSVLACKGVLGHALACVGMPRA